MNNQKLRANLILLLAAAIWGFAFVAQRIGAKYVGAFTFNGVRFALGSMSLVPLILFNRKSRGRQPANEGQAGKGASAGALAAGGLAGGVLFAGASLQQLGMSEASAGKAAFITGLYIVLVPIFGILLKHRIRMNMWAGAVIAAAGLYLLSVTGSFSVARSDSYLMIGAVLWAIHILLIDSLAKKADALLLSFCQFVVCSALSLASAAVFEDISPGALSQAAVPILYGGILSVGVAYTLQVIGQKYAKPSHAAIVLSMESVFASLGGFLLLGENLGLRGYTGCALMLSGMLLSQLQPVKKSGIKEQQSF